MGSGNGFDAPRDFGTASKAGSSELSVGDWQVIVVRPRIDSFSQESLIEEIASLRKRGHKKIALDLRANRFLSLPAIKHCVDVARTMSTEGGAFALVSCPEKTKRHFEIYGSLDKIGVVRTAAELVVTKR